jgi:hypothetical protein
MELSKAESQSLFAEAIKRRDGAMGDVLRMGSGPVGAEDDQPHKPQVGIWKIAGDRSRAGWTDTVATGVQRREGRPVRRAPTAVSGVWLFLLSSVLRRNGLLSLHLWSRGKPPAGQR